MLLVRPRAEISRRTSTLMCQSNSSCVHHWASAPQVYYRSYRGSVVFTFYISILRIILKTRNTKKGKAHEQMGAKQKFYLQVICILRNNFIYIYILVWLYFVLLCSMIRRKDDDSSDQYCNFNCWQYCIQSFELSWRGNYLEVCACCWTIFRHAIWSQSDVIHVQQKLLTSVKFRCSAIEALLPPFCSNFRQFNPINAELNPICYLLALLAHNFLHVSRIRVKSLTLRLLMSYIYIYIYIWSAYS